MKGYAINPYARYTFYRTGNLSLFADAGFAYAKLEQAGYDAKGWEVGIDPGIAYNLSEKFSITAKFGYLGYSDIEESKKFGLSLDNDISFSLYYSF